MSNPPFQDPMDTGAKKDEVQPQPAGGYPGLPQVPQNSAVSRISPMPALTHSSSNPAALRDTPSDSGHTSASVLARGSETKWTDWQEQNKCSLNDGIRNIEEVEAFSNALKYPRLVKDEKIVKWLRFRENNAISRTRPDPESVMRYEVWANALKEDKFEMDDPFEYEVWYPTLFRDWDSHSSANVRSGNEYARRKGVDCMIELAFQLRLGAKHAYLPEEELALSKSPWTAKADAITVIRLPFEWADFLQSLPNSHVFTSSRAGLSVPTFVFEAKQTATTPGSRQLTLDFCSLQHQRRALGIKDGPIFGATLVGSIFMLYVSMWREDRIVVYAIGKSFDLNSLPAFVRCYFFLCKLSEYISQEVEKQFERWKTDGGKKELEERSREASAKPWRPKERPKAPSDAPRKRRRDGEGGAQDDWDVQEFDEREGLDENDPEIATMVSDIENGDPVPIGGYPLIVKRLVAHDIYCAKHPRTLDASDVKDIRGWARRSSDGQLDMV